MKVPRLPAIGDHAETAENAGELTNEPNSSGATKLVGQLTVPEKNVGEPVPSPELTTTAKDGLASSEGLALAVLGNVEWGLDESGRPPSNDMPPAFGGSQPKDLAGFRAQLTRAAADWLARSPSRFTRQSYALDLRQFFAFREIPADNFSLLICVRPGDVAAWRDSLQAAGATNSTIRRKLTTLRSLFSYLNLYGYTGANPAHGKFVKAPSVPRDGKTVGLSPKECRLLLNAPDPETPAGVRDRALFGVLAYTGCRVGELCRLRVSDYRATGGHKVLTILGKGGKERTVPLHPEAFERIERWLEISGIREQMTGPLFRPTKTARGQGRDGFMLTPLARRSVEQLVERYVTLLKLDPAVTVHSLRVTALTTARERGSDIIDLQDFAGHADPRTTLSYIRSRDRLSKSPAYLLAY